MKASDYIIDFFARQNVGVIFGYIGGMITHLVHSIDTRTDVKFVQAYHEQSAALAAEGYARITGGVGVAIATSGPGATNMVTGIANAYFDSIPMIYITGQVNSYEYKYQRPIRQMGFQETDVVSLVAPITKYAVLVDKPENLRYELEKAYHIATTGRKGPVLLDITMDVQRINLTPDQLEAFVPDVPDAPVLTVTQKEQLVDLISAAERPMILVGGGVVSSGAQALFYELNKRLRVPIVCSLMGKGAYPEDDDLFVGMIGSYGNRCANMAIANSDVLLALGTRLDTRQTGAKYQNFVKHGKIIHVDIDQDELTNHRLINNRISIRQDVKDFLHLLSVQSWVNTKPRVQWDNYIASLKNNYSQEKEVDRFVSNSSPYQLMQAITNYSRPGDVFCSDIGQNQMWAAQMLHLTKGRKYFTSGGLAPMGYAIPAAVGVAFGGAGAWALCGDGGFHISTQSLMLISQYNLPVKVVVINNESLGMITQFQELYFDNRMAGTAATGGYLVPHINKMAEAYNLPYFYLRAQDLGNATLLQQVFSQRNCIIEFSTEGITRVSPKLEFDKEIYNPSPHLDAKELEANMLVKE